MMPGLAHCHSRMQGQKQPIRQWPPSQNSQRPSCHSCCLMPDIAFVGGASGVLKEARSVYASCEYSSRYGADQQVEQVREKKKKTKTKARRKEITKEKKEEKRNKEPEQSARRSSQQQFPNYPPAKVGFFLSPSMLACNIVAGYSPVGSRPSIRVCV